MRNFILAMSLFSGMLLITSCSSDNNNNQEATEAVATPGEPVIGGDSILNDEERDLFNHIARHNLFSITIGRTAAQRGVTSDVKDYAQRQVDWYITKQQELADMARTYDVQLEQEVYQDYRDDVDDITNAKNESFDDVYWENLIDAQKELLDKYEDVVNEVPESENASAFSIWARTSMKELRAQMESAMAYHKQLRDRT